MPTRELLNDVWEIGVTTRVYPYGCPSINYLKRRFEMKKGMFLTLLWCGVVVADMSRSGEIVTDSKTKLMWQDNAEASTVTRNWQGAIDYCEALNFGGYDDWRLPNINELKSIKDRTGNNPVINSVFVNVRTNNYYWSSTSVSGYTHVAWRVGFGDGSVSRNFKEGSNFPRCVRGGR